AGYRAGPAPPRPGDPARHLDRRLGAARRSARRRPARPRAARRRPLRPAARNRVRRRGADLLLREGPGRLCPAARLTGLGTPRRDSYTKSSRCVRELAAWGPKAAALPAEGGRRPPDRPALNLVQK